MRCRIVLLLLAAGAELSAGIYNHAWVYQTFPCWVNACNGNSVCDVVHLRGGFSGDEGLFCRQAIGTPRILVQPTGEWWIFGYGDSDMGPSGGSIGDAIYRPIRLASGQYKTDPNCLSTATPILSMPAIPGDCTNWGYWGGLSTGIAVIKAPQSNICGFQYYGLVGVMDYGNCTPFDKTDDRYYLAWAISADGVNWKFWKGQGSPSNCNDSLNWDANPKNAAPIVYRETYRSDSNDGTFWHYAGFHSDPALGGDGYFYVLFGFAPSVGLWPLSIRLNLCTSDIRGFCGQAEMYYGVNRPCGARQGYCSFNGMIPKSFDCASNSFLSNVADVSDWKLFKKSTGVFSHLAVIYDAGTTFATGRWGLRTSQNIKFPFTWTEERDFEVCKLAEDGYLACNAAGFWSTGIAAPSAYDAGGDPSRFYAFSSTNRTNCGAPECEVTPMGVEPVEVYYSAASHLPEVQNLRIRKAPLPCLTLTWQGAAGADSYQILEGHLSDLRTGTYSHKRTHCGITGTSADSYPGQWDPAPDGAYYYLITASCEAGSEGSPGYARTPSGQAVERPVAAGPCRRHGQPLCPP